MNLLQELLEMCSSEYEELMNDKSEKEYVDEDHAKEEAANFIARAKQILKYNKKPGESGDVNSLAKQFAKDYYDSIVDEIEKFKYGSSNKDEENGIDDYEPMDDYEGRM